MRLCYLALGRFYGGFFVVGSVLLFAFSGNVQKRMGTKSVTENRQKGSAKRKGNKTQGEASFSRAGWVLLPCGLLCGWFILSLWLYAVYKPR
jgi:hypothetical protein